MKKIRPSKTTRALSVILLFTALLVGAESCSKESADSPESVSPAEPANPNPNPNQPFLVTQAQLDAATFISAQADTMILGNPFVEREVEMRNRLRDIVSNIPKNQQPRVGSIFVIRAFENNDGRRGRLLFADIMVKREAGFSAQSGDFENMRIMFDATTDYNLHPNGMLPPVSDTDRRGVGTSILSVNCVDCHRRTPDFLFYN